jgi:hypothetical protein
MMMVRRPACGKATEAHEAHRFARWSSDSGLTGRCEGWTVPEASASRMLAEVGQAVYEHRAANPVMAPPLRFELGPAAELALTQILDLRGVPLAGAPFVDYGLQLGGGAHIDALFGVPLILSRDLPSRAWRLIVPGPVVAAGEVNL